MGAQTAYDASEIGSLDMADRESMNSSRPFNHLAYQELMGSREAPTRLSTGENEVLALVAEGLSNGEIAHRLSITSRRAADRIRWLKLRLQARSRAEMGVIALERGLLVGKAAARQAEKLRERDSLIASLREPRSFPHRQVDLLVLIAAGFSNREISERLGVSPKSMVRRIRELKMELNARTRADLVEIAEQRGRLSLSRAVLDPSGEFPRSAWNWSREDDEWR